MIASLYAAFASEYSCPEQYALYSTRLKVIIFYDYALCLEQEIELFWRAKFLWPTWIFLLNRYVLVLYGVSCLLQIPRWTTPTVCYADMRFQPAIGLICHRGAPHLPTAKEDEVTYRDQMRNNHSAMVYHKHPSICYISEYVPFSAV